MAQIVIEVPDEVYQSLKALAASKGIPFVKFCKAALCRVLYCGSCRHV